MLTWGAQKGRVGHPGASPSHIKFGNDVVWLHGDTLGCMRSRVCVRARVYVYACVHVCMRCVSWGAWKIGSPYFDAWLLLGTRCRQDCCMQRHEGLQRRLGK